MGQNQVCLICSGGYRSATFAGLLQCSNCGFLTADISLSREELERLYSKDYFQGQEYRDYASERMIFEKQFKRRLKTLLRYIPQERRNRLFEIGSAYGFFLNVAQRFFNEVSGIDLSREACSYAVNAMGVRVATGDFLEYQLDEEQDVVCLWDTIEHLAAPHLYIEKVAANMPVGGILAITTGDVGSLVARWRKAKWRQIHPPTHIHYFSKKTLRRLLGNFDFEVRYAGYDGSYRSADTVAYIILALKHSRPEWYERLKSTGLLNWSFYLNLFDTMYVIAEKQR